MTDENSNSNEEEVETEEVEISQEQDHDWKKRYSDLRRHVSEKDSTIAQLRRDLDMVKSNNTNNIPLPEDDSEGSIEEWKAQFPELYKNISKIADKIASNRTQELAQVSEEVKQLRIEAQREKAKKELSTYHPDWEDIVASKTFSDWVAGRSQKIKDVIQYSLDPAELSEVLDFFKSQNNKIVKAKENVKAAEVVGTKTNKTEVADNTKAKSYSESQIEIESKKDPEWYGKHRDAIKASMVAGTFKYDLSHRGRNTNIGAAGGAF